ncbi:xylulokinase [Saccharopolyspora mangrovi]|uniref:FGGY family carbohydrate kinase n=1 Tax=Saccharopolyspora mangrovi TaxID=3082379 RepID=A0ABU6ABK0_9PSEU|nr:FGGY family carbohydrate kinase [Saccharopolyspora sp. S2-29]MEB3368885.1 FGGY family carbohydrate kinase [Saccharopolyspora sp. S2-29]
MASDRAEVLLGIDVGTSGVKVVATDREGRLVRSATARYDTQVDSDGRGSDQDAGSWWHAITSAAGDVVAEARVLAVAVTSQSPTLVPVDDRGREVGAALTWLDRQAVAEAAEIERIGPGHRNGPDPFFGTAKLPWLLRNRPEVAARAAHVVSANGYVTGRLTGRAALDDSSASLMQGFDESANAFDERLFGRGLGVELLPPIVATTDVIGTVTDQAAAETGIPAGVPVVAGGVDSVGSALEAGIVEVGGPLVEMTGFSSATMLAVPAGTHVPGFIHERHCVPGVDLLITAQVTAGATVDWVNRIAGQDLRDSEALLARSRPSRLTTVPSFAGERTPTWNPRARGIIDGIDLAADGVELMLSVLEGNALALADDVAELRARGFAVDRLLSTGGGSASTAWLQIKADALGVPVLRPRGGHGAAQGASYLAGLAIGVHDVGELKQFAADIEHEFTPDAELHERYEHRRAHFSRVRELNRARAIEKP